MPLIKVYNTDSDLYEKEPSAILHKQLQPKTASSYRTFGDEAQAQQATYYKNMKMDPLE
jgi:hypothetical protein